MTLDAFVLMLVFLVCLRYPGDRSEGVPRFDRWHWPFYSVWNLVLVARTLIVTIRMT